jgi:hypothetical protein
MTTQRLYWNNLDTAICSDIPSEAKLVPENWARWRIIPREMLLPVRPPAPPATPKPGLKWKYIEGDWTGVDDWFDKPHQAQGVAELPDLKGTFQRNHHFGVIYDGFIQIPRSGRWSFSGYVDDACRIWISGLPAVSETGAGSRFYQSPVMNLEAGSHPLRIAFVQRAGESKFHLEWSGPEQEKATVPAGAFQHQP